TNNKSDSEPNVTVCDTLQQRTSQAHQQSSLSSTITITTTTISSTASAASSAEAKLSSTSSSSDRHSELSDYGSIAGSKTSAKDRESPFSSPDEGIDMEDAEVDFKNSSSTAQ